MSGHSLREEKLNALSHGVACLLALVGVPVLIVHATSADAWHVVGASVFGFCLIATLAASMLYHGAVKEGLKARLRILDHSAIFLLIAGSYTPFCLTSLRGPVGWTMLGIVWGIAALGVFLKLRWTGRHERLSLLLYLGMGWMIVFAIGPMMERMLPGTLAWLVGAGVSFTGGVGFYVLDEKPGFHLIWHGCVMAGCACLYGAVFWELP